MAKTEPPGRLPNGRLPKGKRIVGRKKGTPNKYTRSTFEAAMQAIEKNFPKAGLSDYMEDTLKRHRKDFNAMMSRTMPSSAEVAVTGVGTMQPVLIVIPRGKFISKDRTKLLTAEEARAEWQKERQPEYDAITVVEHQPATEPEVQKLKAKALKQRDEDE